MGGLTLGAIGAALIAAVVSLIGLILGKEQKTSEFRQEWVNKLRDEIATYVTNVSAISDQVKLKFDSNNEKLKYLAPFYLAINSAANQIRLRLNPREAEAKEILSIMLKIERASQEDSSLASSDIQKLEDELIDESQKLLKIEWDRVKAGEPTFRWAKRSALIFVFLLSGLLIFSVVSSNMIGSKEEQIERQAEQVLPPPLPAEAAIPAPEATASKEPEQR